MTLLLMSMTLAMTISGLLITISCLLQKKKQLMREKSSPFECGFDPKNTSRLPFSIRFFLIAIMFLIFDIEVSILLPLGIIMGNLPPEKWMLAGMIFLVMVTVGLYYEWKENTLDWMT
uniref:NADH dehydrogenase subunit 3 n=1 Tax=Scalpellum stearnsi TaxID=748153 RepID=UPI00286C920B|nr:NADH dehydrogenase subunit 3 [Scalpellum stearnsi]WKB17945.1 NADH dehydrogenase subunit 3 [Scalpellum stearnsi]